MLLAVVSSFLVCFTEASLWPEFTKFIEATGHIIRDTDELRDIYTFAYERSCARYGAVQASLGEPDPFRLRYRAEIKAIIREVVLVGESITEAEDTIRAYAKAKLPKETWTRFLTVVETELASLHDGNFARYRLRPSEFAAWKNRMLPDEIDG